LGILGDEFGIGLVGLVALAPHQTGVLDAGGIDDADVLLGLGQGIGERLAVGAGAFQAEAGGQASRTAIAGPGEQVGMSGGIVAERSAAWLAMDWQEAGIEGILSFAVSLKSVD
jgi:hypothetical protein